MLCTLTTLPLVLHRRHGSFLPPIHALWKIRIIFISQSTVNLHHAHQKTASEFRNFRSLRSTVSDCRFIWQKENTNTSCGACRRAVPGPAVRSEAQHLGSELLVRQVSELGVSQLVPTIAHGVELLDQLDVPPVDLEPPPLLARAAVHPAVPAHPLLEPLQHRVFEVDTRWRWSRAYPDDDDQQQGGRKQGRRPRHCWRLGGASLLARGRRSATVVHGGAMMIVRVRIYRQSATSWGQCEKVVTDCRRHGVRVIWGWSGAQACTTACELCCWKEQWCTRFSFVTASCIGFGYSNFSLTSPCPVKIYSAF